MRFFGFLICFLVIGVSFAKIRSKNDAVLRNEGKEQNFLFESDVYATPELVEPSIMSPVEKIEKSSKIHGKKKKKSIKVKKSVKSVEKSGPKVPKETFVPPVIKPEDIEQDKLHDYIRLLKFDDEHELQGGRKKTRSKSGTVELNSKKVKQSEAKVDKRLKTTEKLDILAPGNAMVRKLFDVI